MQSVLREIVNRNVLEENKKKNKDSTIREGIFRAVPAVVIPSTSEAVAASSTVDSPGTSLYSLIRSRLNVGRTVDHESSDDLENEQPVTTQQVETEDNEQPVTTQQVETEDNEQLLACPCLNVQLSGLQGLAVSLSESINAELSNIVAEDAAAADRSKRILLLTQKRQHALAILAAASNAEQEDCSNDSSCAQQQQQQQMYMLKVSQVILPMQLDRLFDHERHYFVCLFRSPIGCLYASGMADSGQVDFSEATNLPVPCAVSVPSLTADFEVTLQVYWLRLGSDAPLSAGGCSYRVPNKRRRFFPRLGVKSLLPAVGSDQQQHRAASRSDGQFVLLGEAPVTMELVRLSAGCVSIEAPSIGACPLVGHISLRCGVQIDASAGQRWRPT